VSAVGIQLGIDNCVLAAFANGSAEAVPIDTPPADWAQMGFDKVLPSVFALNEKEPIFGWAARQPSGGVQTARGRGDRERRGQVAAHR
jgi:molecular chaperone DnaK (HSP70)